MCLSYIFLCEHYVPSKDFRFSFLKSETRLTKYQVLKHEWIDLATPLYEEQEKKPVQILDWPPLKIFQFPIVFNYVKWQIASVKWLTFISLAY